MPNGFVFYRGPSLLDRAPIVGIVTGLETASRNGKTGPMLQSWIMRADIPPHLAVKTGQDASVCGACPLRPLAPRQPGEKPCYVKTWQGPRSIFEACERGAYPELMPAKASNLTRGGRLRLGAYGNPSAIPLASWRPLLASSSAHTGYIHNWREAAPSWARYVMASVETAADALEAQARGYRVFYVRRSSDPKPQGMVACPASKESGHKTSCFDCIACGGQSSKAKASITIIAH